jgi:hypothetical protein
MSIYRVSAALLSFPISYSQEDPPERWNDKQVLIAPEL